MRNWTGLKKWLTRATLGWVVVTLLLGASGGIVPLEAGSGPYPKLFGTREINSHNLKAFSKWRGMLKRYFKTDQIPEGNCDERTFNTCHLEKWQAFLDSTRHLSATSRRQQIGRVNRSLNSIRYILIVSRIDAITTNHQSLTLPAKLLEDFNFSSLSRPHSVLIYLHI